MARPRFDPSRPLVAARSFTYEGKQYHKGDPMDLTGLPLHNLKTLYGSRYANHPDPGAPPPPEVVQLKEAGGGFYDVSAPWLEAPERIRGKDAAQARVDELKTAGPPLGFIEGGSEVTVEDVGDNKFIVNAPWLENPETLEGREAAETRQREIHSLGEPDSHHGVRLTDGGNGWFEVQPEWGEVEKFEDGEAARARATELRTEGKPLDEVTPWEASVLVTIDGDKFTVTAPTLESPETFDTAEAAEARQKELRDAGPPEGWEPPKDEGGEGSGAPPQQQ